MRYQSGVVICVGGANKSSGKSGGSIIKDLARFDGQRWERIHDPDNERIDE
ncbi:hypothetical protein [Curvibacter gracilis]|uniref:hypothetical protein n=1 Tax=Curvibacter gracilis TaxID=230310 RepID=UPI0004B91118|nr:hypothetical protein [Curvibacter gracilis]